LVGHNLARHFEPRGEHALEKPLGCSLVATLLLQDIEFGTVLVNGAPRQVRLAAQHHKHFVKVPGRTGLATRRLNAMREARTELLTPAPNRLVPTGLPSWRNSRQRRARTVT